MTEQHRFGTAVNPITCHAWNKDRTRKYYTNLTIYLRSLLIIT